MNSFGTTESICRAVEKYSSMLLHLALTRLSSPADAEDTVQEYTLCVGNLRAQGETRFALLESSGAIYSISAQSVQPLMDAVSGALDQ